MRPLPALAMALLVTAGSVPGPADGDPAGASAQAEATVDAALGWLHAQQREDGTFPFHARLLQALSQSTDPHPFAWPAQHRSVIDTYMPPAADAAWSSNLWAAHGLASAGYDPRDFAGVDLVARIRDGFDGTQFGDVQSIMDDAWAILALTAAGIPPGDDQVQAAATRIDAAQNTDGGWTWNGVPSSASGADESAWGVLALHWADALDGATTDAARGFFSDRMAPDGSYEPVPGAGPNCQTTAWALHARHTLGMAVPPKSLDFLLTCRHENGGLKVTPDAPNPNIWATAEIVPVLAGHLMPWHGLLQDLSLSGATDTDVTTPVPWHAESPGTDPAALSVTWHLPDGRVLTGTSTDIAIDVPGEHLIHVHAASDATHARASHTLQVTNGAPAWGPLPATLYADRVNPLTFSPVATDPEGSPVHYTWQVGDQEGEGPVQATLTSLGRHDLHLAAHDPHGAAAQALLAVVVENLAPRIRALDLPATVPAGTPFPFAVDAFDPDAGDASDAEGGGADPIQVVWHFPTQVFAGTNGTATLPAGDHTVTLRVTDRDGAVASRTVAVSAATGAGPDHGGDGPGDVDGRGDVDGPGADAGASPRITRFDAARGDGVLVVAIDYAPPEAMARLTWSTAFGTFHRAVTPGVTTLPLQVPGDTVHFVRVDVTGDAGAVHAQVGPLSASTPPDAGFLPLDGEGPEADGAGPAGQAAGAEGAARQRQEAPAWQGAVLLALAAATLSGRARRP